MTSVYSHDNCFICGARISVAGFARGNHMRKHVRQGVLSEYRDTGPYGGLSFDRIQPGTTLEVYLDGESRGQRNNTPAEIAQSLNARIKTIKRYGKWPGEWTCHLELETIPPKVSKVK